MQDIKTLHCFVLAKCFTNSITKALNSSFQAVIYKTKKEVQLLTLTSFFVLFNFRLFSQIKI